MNKSFLIAILVGLIILPGCKKSDSSLESSSNFFVKDFKLAEQSIGENKEKVIDILTKNGWKIDIDEEGGGLRCTSKDGKAYVMASFFSDNGKAWSVEFFYENSIEEIGNVDTYIDFIKYLGASPTIKGIQHIFNGDYDAFVENFKNVFNEGWSAHWTGGEDNILQFEKDSSQTSLRLYGN